jgi:hypothetical protein
VVEFFRNGQEKQNKAAAGRKTGIFGMTFTGTLIDDLMAAVERAEKREQSDRAIAGEPMFAETMAAETWFASVQQNADYDSKLLGVA